MKGVAAGHWALVELAPGRLTLCQSAIPDLIRNEVVSLITQEREVVGRVSASGLQVAFMPPGIPIAKIFSRVTWQQLAASTDPETVKLVSRVLAQFSRPERPEGVYEDPIGRYLVVALSGGHRLPAPVLIQLSAATKRAVVQLRTKPQPTEPAQIPPDQSAQLQQLGILGDSPSALAKRAVALLEAINQLSPGRTSELMAMMSRPVITPAGKGLLTVLNVLRRQAAVLLPDGRQVWVPLSQVSLASPEGQ